MDNMIVLEGEQGSLKSTALGALGGPWYAEVNESVQSKDFHLSLQGKMIIEIAELDSFSKAETTRIKQVITCQTDRYRKPYGHYTEDHPRTCVFAGSTNEDQYLRDHTGGWRFVPFFELDVEVPPNGLTLVTGFVFVTAGSRSDYRMARESGKVGFVLGEHVVMEFGLES